MCIGVSFMLYKAKSLIYLMGDLSLSSSRKRARCSRARLDLCSKLRYIYNSAHEHNIYLVLKYKLLCLICDLNYCKNCCLYLYY